MSELWDEARMIVIDSAALVLIALLLAATGLGVTWLLIEAAKDDGDDG